MVVGIPDEEAGEVPLAFITLSLDALERCKGDVNASQRLKKDVMKYVSDHKVRYKHLKRVEM